MKASVPNDPYRFAHKYGISRDDVRAYELRNGVTDVAKKYEQQRCSAKRRGVEWLFDLPSWMAVWDGMIAKRGKGLRGYCMCRHKDEGPYAPWNVRIATGYENKLDWWERKPRWFKYQPSPIVNYGATVDSDGPRLTNRRNPDVKLRNRPQ